MKRLALASISIILLFVLCSCDNYNVASTYREKAIDNGFNNYIAGGKLAYTDKALYYNSCFAPKAMSQNAIKFTDKGKTDMLNPHKKYSVFYLNNFYQYNNKIYCVLEDDKFLSVYDKNMHQFIKSDINLDAYGTFYLSRDLKIKYKSSNKLNINYKGKDIVAKLDLGINSFYPVGDVIYLQNYRGWLYSFDLNTPEKEPELIDELLKDTSNIFSVCGDYVYYDYNGDDDKTANGLYRYSLVDKTNTLVIDKTVSSINFLKDKCFFVADGKLYYDTMNSEPEKLSDLKTKSIYIFDNRWIYLDDSEGGLYRFDRGQHITEKIDLYSK